jgi:hypothetical protein
MVVIVKFDLGLPFAFCLLPVTPESFVNFSTTTTTLFLSPSPLMIA